MEKAKQNSAEQISAETPSHQRTPSPQKRYRCPYCKHLFDQEPPPRCPSCGKLMVVPSMRQPSPRMARKRKIEQIRRETEMKKSALQMLSPSFWRNPKFYFGVIAVLAILGGMIFNATDKVNKKKAESPLLRAIRHVDVLAEALGRYHFHTGVYPTRELGLAALVRNPKIVPKWDGPYINLLRKDPWGIPFQYAPPKKPGDLPIIFSCGPDQIAGTADDIHPDVTRFDPGTAWTNGWVSEERRMPGIWVIPSNTNIIFQNDEM